MFIIHIILYYIGDHIILSFLFEKKNKKEKNELY